MNALTLRAIAAAWLRYDRQCPLVTFERGLDWADRPDVYALTKDRLLLEIEIKISMSDYKHDRAKWKWKRRERGYGHIPAYFYFLTPSELAERIKHTLPDGAGLLTVSHPDKLMHYTGLPELECLVKPRRHPQSQKVRIQDAMTLVKHQTGTLCGLACSEGYRALITNLHDESIRIIHAQ